MDHSDDAPALSADSLAALQSFLAEKQEQDDRFAKLQENAHEAFEESQKITMDYFQEDWQLSQFWYNDDTAGFLAQTAIDHTTEDDIVVFISSPTAYVAYRNMVSEQERRQNAYVFEYDQRFAVFKSQFVLYNFNQPLEFAKAEELKHKVKFIVADPPFLNEDCLSQTLETVKRLAAEDGSTKVVINTGAVMEKLANKLIGAKITNFHPAHRGGLSNEFRCYSTFEDDKLKWATTTE